MVQQSICGGDCEQVASEQTNKPLPREVGGRPFRRPPCPPLPILLVGARQYKSCSRHETVGANAIALLRLVVVLVDGQ
jgi:hypothetical protein